MKRPGMRGWARLLLWPLLAAFLMLVVGMFLPPTYTARLQLTVRHAPPTSASAALSLRSLSFYGALLRSQRLGDRVIEHFQLQQVYGEDSLSATRERLARKVRMGQVQGLLVIEADDRYPWRAADLAQRHWVELVALLDELRRQAQQDRIAMLGRELQRMDGRLLEAQQALARVGIDAASLRLDPGQRHGPVQALQTQLRRAEVRLSELQQVHAEDSFPLQRQGAEVQALHQALRSATQAQISPEQDAGGYAVAQREFRHLQALQTTIRRELEQARIDQTYKTEQMLVVDAAAIPELRSGPHVPRMMLGAWLFTLAALSWRTWLPPLLRLVGVGRPPLRRAAAST